MSSVQISMIHLDILTHGCGIIAVSTRNEIMAPQSVYEAYVHKTKTAIKDLLATLEVQPILFIGAGMSRRYFDAPDWHGALNDALDYVPDGGPEYNYYRQLHGDDTIKIGTIIAERMHKWAWNGGKTSFPAELFKAGVSPDIFVKHVIAEALLKITPSKSSLNSIAFADEISSLRSIRPHAIITTNFDNFLEGIFDGYEPIVGQSVIRYNMNSFGEIYKIHGSVDDISSIVLTQSDYDEFRSKKKYISAKLVTYLAEHPVFIFGYGFADPNVKAILEDIGEIITNSDGVIPNIYYVKWDADADAKNSLPDEYVIHTSTNQYRVKAIVTKNFKWIYDILSHNQGLTSINTKLVRALAARAFKLIRSDIPRGTVEVNYEVLERVSDNSKELPQLLGITQADNPNLTHPFVLSQVAEKLGYASWQKLNKYLEKIKTEKGVDLRATDNKYYCKVKTGKKDSSKTGKWSVASIDLFKKVIAGKEYEIDI